MKFILLKLYENKKRDANLKLGINRFDTKQKIIVLSLLVLMIISTVLIIPIMFPVLDVGEALVVGDASLLPSRIVVKRPDPEPNSSTVKFWDEWAKKSTTEMISLSNIVLKGVVI